MSEAVTKIFLNEDDSKRDRKSANSKPRKFEAYLIVNLVNGKRYIGIATYGAAYRWQEHQKHANYGLGFALHSAIRKYGAEMFEVSIIGSAESWADLCFMERYFIKHYGTLSPNGYNLTWGGEGGLGHTVSPDARARISEANKRWGATEEGRIQLFEAAQKRIPDPGWITARLRVAKELSADPTWKAAISNGKIQANDISDPDGVTRRAILRKIKKEKAALRELTGDVRLSHLDRDIKRISDADALDPDGAEERRRCRERTAKYRALRKVDPIISAKDRRDMAIAERDTADPDGANRRAKHRVVSARQKARKAGRIPPFQKKG